MNKHLITCILLVPLVCSCGKQATTSVDTREPLLLNDSLQEIITLDTVRDTPLTNELLLNGRVSFNPERVEGEIHSALFHPEIPIYLRS